MMKNRVKQLRESLEISQAELARLVDIARQSLSAIEANKQEPSLQLALRLARILRSPVEQIFPLERSSSMNTLSHQLESYQDVLDSIFGKGACQVNTKQQGVNNIIGGITRDEDSTFDSFRKNFIERLRRLERVYRSDARCLQTIRRLATEVGTGDGSGSYAEIAAIDFMNRAYLENISSPVALDVNIPAQRTFASGDVSRQVSNLDGFIEEWNLYFDVKTLRDVTDGILRKPIRELAEKYDAMILPEREYAYDYAILQNRVTEIKAVLEEALRDRKTYAQVGNADGLAFRIAYRPGIVSAMSTVDPYKAAQLRHRAIFDFGDKFVRDAPFVLVLAVPPWTHSNLSSFDDMDNKFFRALCRRVYCQYIDSAEIHPKFNASYSDLSRAISMIVFLQLHETLGKEKEVIGCQTFSNPNAKHPCQNIMLDFFYAQRVAIQSFEFDNY
ncbi:MAG: helix-turn-helix transcriptional regulator [Leptolyngbya sp.]|nr:helix-turn-helix transcriptional regulator [Candidatus Melainabacteria bacterium]